MPKWWCDYLVRVAECLWLHPFSDTELWRQNYKLLFFSFLSNLVFPFLVTLPYPWSLACLCAMCRNFLLFFFFSFFLEPVRYPVGVDWLCLCVYVCVCVCMCVRVCAPVTYSPSRSTPAVLIYAVTASYFSGVMVRLILTLTPIVCVMAAICISSVLEKQLGSSILELDSVYSQKATSEAYSMLTEEKTGKVGDIQRYLYNVYNNIAGTYIQHNSDKLCDNQSLCITHLLCTLECYNYWIQ